MRMYLDDGSVSCSPDGQHRLFLSKNPGSIRRTSSLENLSLSDCAIGKRQADDLVVLWEFDLAWLSTRGSIGSWSAKKEEKTDILEDDEGTVDTANSVVLEVRLDPVGAGRVSWVTHCCCVVRRSRGSCTVVEERRRWLGSAGVLR